MRSYFFKVCLSITYVIVTRELVFGVWKLEMVFASQRNRRNLPNMPQITLFVRFKNSQVKSVALKSVGSPISMFYG